jgi:hypothetical protein
MAALTREQKDREFARLKKRLKNAKTRALYWSGNPSFAQNRYVPSRVRRHASEQYELALCDIESLCEAIFQHTGKRPEPYDPKASFAATFSVILGAVVTAARRPR